MGRKPRETPSRIVRIDADLVSQCEWLARDKGLSIGRYLSDVVRPVVSREWSALIRTSHQVDDQG